MVMIALKLILFFLSEFGYFIALERKTKINRSFIPMVTVSSQVCVLFLGGILNLLKPVSFILYFGGFYFLLRTIYLNKGIGFVREYLFDINYIFLITMSILCIAALHGRLFEFHDNFSHWALITKQMLAFDRLPNFQDTIIEYQDYPPGTACFIYYFSSFVSEKEWLQMFAQAFINLSCISAIFVFCRRENKILPFLYAIIFSNFMMVWFKPFRDLLVDTVLGLSGAFLIVFVVYYCKSQSEKLEYLKLVWYLPISVFCILVKNSGLLYCAIASVVIFLHSNKQSYKKMFLLAVFPYLSLILWKSHTKYVYLHAGSSKHALDIASYIRIFNRNDHDFILEICRKMLNFSITGNSFYIFLIVILISAVLYKIFYPTLFSSYKKILYFFFAFYILYSVGMLFMYLFSMPPSEASYLAQAERYRSTCFISIYLVMSIFSIAALSESELLSRSIFISTSKIVKTVIPNISFFIILCLIWVVNKGSCVTIFTLPDGAINRRIFEKELVNYEVEKDKSYFFLFHKNTSSFRYYLMRYLYYTNPGGFIFNADTEGVRILNNYDYIFNYDDRNENVMNWIRENYPEQIQRTVIKTLRCIDDIDEYLDSITNSNYLVLISINDEAASNLSDITQEKLRNLGLQQDWSADMVRKSYIAVIYQGEVQEMSGGRIYLDDQINDEINYEVVSAGFNDKGGPIASIRINDIEYSKNKRGINIVVYNPINQTVIDSVNFDTYLAGNPVFR